MDVPMVPWKQLDKKKKKKSGRDKKKMISHMVDSYVCSGARHNKKEKCKTHKLVSIPALPNYLVEQWKKRRESGSIINIPNAVVPPAYTPAKYL